jgi:thymidine kinase
MFSWLVTKTNNESVEQQSENGNKIPRPPLVNMKIAQAIKEKHYNPRFYCHPDDFTEQIKEEYQRRQLKFELASEYLNRVYDEVSCDNLGNRFEKRKREMDEGWSSMSSLEFSDESNDLNEIPPPPPTTVSPCGWGSPESVKSEKSKPLYISVEGWSDTEDNLDGIEWHTSPFSHITGNNPFEIVPSNNPFEIVPEPLLNTSADLDNMETQIVVEKILPQEKKVYPENSEGYLEIFMGPMFSGKSTRALFKLSSMADQRFSCLYINSSKDVRETVSQDNFISTHNSSYSKPSPKITCVKAGSLATVNVDDFEYIAVDELQFFTDAYETILEWIRRGKYIIIASLDGDCYRRKFGCVLDLIPHANEVTKLTSYCDICRDHYRKLTPAPFTARLTNDTTSELVGGVELYKAMCRQCHDYHLEFTVKNI